MVPSNYRFGDINDVGVKSTTLSVIFCRLCTIFVDFRLDILHNEEDPAGAEGDVIWRKYLIL